MHTDVSFYTPEMYAASAAVSHSLTALNQDDSKRLHSSTLSSTCQDRENNKNIPSQVRTGWVSRFHVQVHCYVNDQTNKKHCVEVRFGLTSARWPMITCQIASSSAVVSFPSEAKYRLCRATSVCTACWQTEEDTHNQRYRKSKTGGGQWHRRLFMWALFRVVILTVKRADNPQKTV